MKKKIVVLLVTFVLIVFPFLVGTSIGNFSPYVEGNSFQRYVIIWAAISIALISGVLLITKYLLQSFERGLIGGVLLFLLICPIIGILGLVEPPDLSLKMLDHPEREHLRYIFLFMAAILFGVFAVFFLMTNSFQIKKSTKLIVTIVFVLALLEFLWEFTHHYFYPEALKEWIDQGKSAEEFSKDYDNITIINIGVLGRLIQFSLIVWLSIHLYNSRQIKIWCPIITVLFSLIGIISATIIYMTQMNLPQGFEILFLFFIPGIPFILLYWLGVAVLTKFKKSKIVDKKL